jgi:hypothetical protein
MKIGEIYKNSKSKAILKRPRSNKFSQLKLRPFSSVPAVRKASLDWNLPRRSLRSLETNKNRRKATIKAWNWRKKGKIRQNDLKISKEE